jgi:hypothetical protein
MPRYYKTTAQKQKIYLNKIKANCGPYKGLRFVDILVKDPDYLHLLVTDGLDDGKRNKRNAMAKIAELLLSGEHL